MKKTRKLLIILTGIILILLTSNVYAISNLNDYDPSRPTTAEAQSFLDKQHLFWDLYKI